MGVNGMVVEWYDQFASGASAWPDGRRWGRGPLGGEGADGEPGRRRRWYAQTRVTIVSEDGTVTIDATAELYSITQLNEAQQGILAALNMAELAKDEEAAKSITPR
jgi:hypothetical protein